MLNERLSAAAESVEDCIDRIPGRVRVREAAEISSKRLSGRH